MTITLTPNAVDYTLRCLLRVAARYFLLFMIAYAIEVNISGGLWYCPPLLCALGYSLTLPSINASTKPDEQTSCSSDTL